MVQTQSQPNSSSGGVSWGLKLPNCGGVLCPPDWAQPETILALAGAAERHGFDTVWLHDHLVTPAELRHLGAPRFHEPLITMATVASARPKLRVGVATIVLPLRDPVLLAKQVSTLASFFPGRLLIGLGAGRYASEFEVLGLDHFERRGSLSAEHLEIIRSLLTKHEVTHSGPSRSLRGASMYPQPAERPHLLYAGNSAAAARRAARLADGWIGASMPPEELKQTVGTMRSLRLELGLDDPFDIAYSATIVRDEGSPVGRAMSSEKEELHLHASTISGDGHQVSAQLADYIAAGVTHLQLSLRAATLDELAGHLSWFESEVISRQDSTVAPSRP
jgi:alkanesulfonate monooxygenase SsuD/methylene tetrahydromethanopterin reductase-like flavin-dependent oxidoreductase (luciferase family)